MEARRLDLEVGIPSPGCEHLKSRIARFCVGRADAVLAASARAYLQLAELFKKWQDAKTPDAIGFDRGACRWPKSKVLLKFMVPDVGTVLSEPLAPSGAASGARPYELLLAASARLRAA